MKGKTMKERTIGRLKTMKGRIMKCKTLKNVE